MNANEPLKNSTTLFLDVSQMRKLKATIKANVPFKNNCINLFYHTTQISEFEVILNANVSSKRLKFKKNFAKVWKY